MKLAFYLNSLGSLTVLVSICLPATGQQVPAISSSTISGRVVCSDTNAPARFGKVFLKSTQPGGFGDDFEKRLQDSMEKAAAKSGRPAPKPPTEDEKRTQAAAARNMNRATDLLGASTIGLDGEYSFRHVKPGTYYLHVLFPGYVDPLEQFSDDDLASTDPAVLARIASSVTTVTVSGTDSMHTDLRLERGASVSGRVIFDDGAPAVGWTITVIRPKTLEDPRGVGTAAMRQALIQSGAVLAAKTDDVGNYRLAGLPAGEYILQASLEALGIGVNATNLGEAGSGISLVVYSQNSFSRSEAKSFSITAGENRSGVDVTVPSHKLHNIVGHVYAKVDTHAINSGQVSLSSKDNSAIHFKAAIRDDGSFHFEYLPPGTYSLKVDNAADAQTTGTATFLGMSIPKQDILRKYGIDSADVVLRDSDLDSVRLTVAETDWKPPVKKPGTDVDPGAALGGLLGTLLSGDGAEGKSNPK